jgi:hypothetical protein
MQTDFPIWKEFSAGITDSGRELSVDIHLMIPHIDISLGIHNPDQVSSHNLLTLVRSRQYITRLTVKKHRLVRHLGIRRTRHRAETLVVVVHGMYNNA